MWYVPYTVTKGTILAVILLNLVALAINSPILPDGTLKVCVCMCTCVCVPVSRVIV